MSMLRRTLLVLPTTFGLLLGMSLPAEAQSCGERAWTWDRLNGRWVRNAVTTEPGPRETTAAVGRVRFDEGPYVNPRAPRAWQPAPAPAKVTVTTECAPVPSAPRRAWQPHETRQQGQLTIPAAEPVPCAPATTCAPREWRPTTTPSPQPARFVPREWRSALPSHALLDAHRRLLGATDCPARRLVIAEIARQWTVTVDQVITFVGARPAAERLEALTALHPATTDASCYARTYGLLADDDSWTLHVRITRTFDARTAAQHERLQRLRREEQELQRVLGD
jgi:hypothetical protein